MEERVLTSSPGWSPTPEREFTRIKVLTFGPLDARYHSAVGAAAILLFERLFVERQEPRSLFLGFAVMKMVSFSSVGGNDFFSSVENGSFRCAF